MQYIYIYIQKSQKNVTNEILDVLVLTFIVGSLCAACNAGTAANCRHTSVDIWKYCSVNCLYGIVCGCSISRDIRLPHAGCIDRHSLAGCCTKHYTHTHCLPPHQLATSLLVILKRNTHATSINILLTVSKNLHSCSIKTFYTQLLVSL